MSRFTIIATLLVLSLSACSSRYQAPVGQLGDAPLFLDSGRVHRVNGGETLYAIAWMYDLDVNALARANNLQDPYLITVGQVLTVDLRNQTFAPAVPETASSTVAVSRPVVTAPAIQRTPLSTAPLTRTPLPSAEPPGSSTPSAGDVPPITPRSEPSTRPPVIPAPSAAPPVVATVTPPVVPLPEPVVEPAPVPVVPKAIANADINWGWPASGSIIGRFGDSGMEDKGVDFDGNRGDTIMAAADGEVVYAGSGLLRYGDLVILKHNDSFLSAYAHNSAILVKEGDLVTRGQKIAELGSSGIDRNKLHFEIRLDGKPVDPLRYLPSR